MRVGVIGNGSAGRNFAHAACFVEGVELVAVAGRSLDRVAPIAERVGAEPMTVEQLLGTDLDCVAIGTPPSLHARQALPFIERGVHAMVEKPMALCAEDCDAIIAAADKAGVRLMVTQTHRYRDYSRRARAIIESGEYGKVVSVTVFMGHNYFSAKRAGWQLDHSMSGGGVAFNPFIHMLDLARYLAGAEVTAFHGHIGCHKEGFEIEGDVQCLLTFANGAAGFVHVDGYGDRLGRWAEVILERASLVILDEQRRVDVLVEGRPARVIGLDPGGRQNADGLWGNQGYINHFVEMRAAVEDGGPITSDGRNGKANVLIARGILEQCGAPVMGPTV